MNVTSTFSQKWNSMISPETENQHQMTALYNHMATIATVVSVLAINIIVSIFAPPLAPFFYMGTFLLIGPAIELGNYFLSNAREAIKLENQANKVRSCYEKFLIDRVPNPELKSLSYHWNKRASEAEKGYKTLFQKAIEEENKPKATASSIKKYRIEALEAEKTAAKIKVYSLFLESLIGNQKTFERLFKKYENNLSLAILEFASWDEREVETRAMSPKFTQNDSLLLFNKRYIQPISYQDVYKEDLQDEIKKKMHLALLTREAALI